MSRPGIASRVAYLRFLRREHRHSPRTPACPLVLQLRLMEKRRELVRMDEVTALIDQIVGVMLTHLSSMPAQCAPRGDLATRRSIERCVFEVRTEIAKVCQQRADQYGEPPLAEQ